ncbi:alpha/beta hydrolase [Spongiivirga citrea]|uniref:Alpha/beta fold hydrolase n=1 Tax=Spongiivirga citrea TaxID=1481457 RepID=A0A6M0CLQ6_9FLAO|nr:alpha/beta hydrolase [Spongiivirga citrea]NER16357.1 alpha/beta fold hydrolase [Spongiivirga citrea]
MKHQEFFLKKYHKQIFAQSWSPDRPKAVILLVHGFGEHSTRYADFVVPTLVENEYAIFTYDNIGHGKSTGKRGDCESYEQLMAILNDAYDEVRERFVDLPVFLYGHSLGGNLVINYTLRIEPGVKGTIASSPYLRLAFKPPKWKMSIGKLFYKIAPSITLSAGLEVNHLTRDKAEVKKYENDPLVHDNVSPMYSFPIMEAGEWAISNADHLKTPMFVAHGTGDKVTSHKASEEFANGSPKATIRLFDGGYHEMHNDFHKQDFMDALITWMNKQL